jgi:zinc/manganese transport system permease protein
MPAAVGVGLSQLFTHAFMRHAFVAGTAVAVTAGLVGYFLVLRAQVFAADALSHVAFTGALAALALGLDVRLGLLAVTIAVGLAMGALDTGRGADDVAIGSVFAWILGVGVLLLALYTRSRSTSDGAAGVSVLFGSIFGLSAARAGFIAMAAAAVCACTLAMARPLLFASVDSAVARARGVPVRLLAIGFLGIVGACAAEATQAVGALLLLGLLAGPAGAAHRLTARPYRALALSAGLAVVAMWAGLTLSYLVPRIPPSFAILSAVTACYAAALFHGALERR